MKLRDYQQNAINAIYDYFTVLIGNPLIVAPTGAGKSVMIAKFVEGVISTWPDQRILMLTHVKELIAQNFEKLMAVYPEAPAGINAASLNQRDTTSSVIFASIQTVYKKAYEIGFFNLVIVDECHLIPEGGEGMYNRLLKDLRRINPKLKVIGFTATPFRLKTGNLIGENTLFTDIAYEIPIKTLIDQGHLSKVVPKATDAEIDVSGVKIRGGEFIAGDLERAVDTEALNRAIVEEIITHGADRKKWLVFCTGVSHAAHIRDEFIDHGINCETVTGDTPKAERERIINDYKAGRIKALTNVNVLTTGFDAPDTDLLACLRPTQSTGLWVQIVGRGMRTAPGKENCLVLDFAGNTLRHGPIDEIKMGNKKAKDEPGEAPAKSCPECLTLQKISALECEECGFVFPVRETPDLTHKASTAQLLSFEAKPMYRGADTITASIYRKADKPPMLRFDIYEDENDYESNKVASDYLCIEHGGYATSKAKSRFQEYTGLRCPDDCETAFGMLKKLDGATEESFFGKSTNVTFKAGKKVCLKKNGKYVNVSKVIAA